jgi:hypothetical protein
MLVMTLKYFKEGWHYKFYQRTYFKASWEVELEINLLCYVTMDCHGCSVEDAEICEHREIQVNGLTCIGVPVSIVDWG